MAGGLDKFVVPGRHTRRPGRAGLRRVCLAALIMLVAQYGLGIFLNLYVAVPASDAHARVFAEIATAPLALTVHALLGLALIGTAILLVARAVGVRDRLLAVLAAAGLTAIGGAFGAGEIFVRNGQPGASLAMAILTGAALLCYVGTGTCVTGTIALAVRSQADALRVASVVLFALLLAAWLVVAARTLRGSATGQLFKPMAAAAPLPAGAGNGR